MSLTKSYDIASFKALPDKDGQTGRFEAVVSVFGNVDIQGDRVLRGAFSKSLDKWRSSGAPIPIIWSHDWADPFAHIGAADPQLARELPQGLKLVGNLDIGKPFAAQVYDLLKTQRVKEWSFSYDVKDERQGEDKANELLELDLIEAGPTLKGANPATQTLGVKAALEAAAKAGRTLSTKNENQLRQAYDIIGSVLSSVAKQEPEEEKAQEPEPPVEPEPVPEPEAKSGRDASLRLRLEAAVADI